MKVLIALACLVAVAAAADPNEFYYQNLFTNWMIKYQRSYNHDEFAYRYRVFKNNADFVEQWNKKGLHQVALNKFADLSTAEFTAKYTGLKYDASKFNTTLVRAEKAPVNAPASFDWRSKGAVTPIKNQGQCGSCWSFSTTGSVEGDVFIEAGVLTSLSEQQLVDCSTAQGNQGCNGGLMDNAFQYIISNGGLTTEAGYPYTATGPNTCNVQTPLASTITSYCDVTSGSETALINAVAQQPVSVAIEADQSCFQFYSSGVMSDPSCGTQLDHGVLAVGFGVVGGVKYWNVKNSWGTSWGNNGYIWLGRQVAGQPLGVCGIASEPSFPYGGKSLSSRAAAKPRHHKH